jgi:secreted trypsin-like serine protease
VELDQSLNISKNANIEEAVLPPPSMKLTGKDVQVVGWGLKGKYSSQSSALLSIDVKISKSQDCLEAHSVTNFGIDRMFCGGTKTETTCNGDSGGGAIYHAWGVPVILGVVSFGKETCKTSTVYTKIEAFLPWIFNVTNIK